MSKKSFGTRSNSSNFMMNTRENRIFCLVVLFFIHFYFFRLFSIFSSRERFTNGNNTLMNMRVGFSSPSYQAKDDEK